MMMIVKDLMSDDITQIGPEARLSEAVTLMGEQKRSCVIIVKNNTPIGIITERDIVGVFVQAINTKTFDDVLVTEVMTENPVSYLETTSLIEAVAEANQNQLRHFPVVDDKGMLVGLVTQTDMVQAYISLFEKQVQLEATNQRLESLAHQDALLGIGNRRAMELDLTHIQATALRNKKPYAAVLFDVDYFKKYNDHYGHLAGDIALKTTTEALLQSMRESDRLYRYGGEEFLLLMPDTNIEGAKKTAERACKAVADKQVPHTGSPTKFLTISAGVACSTDENWQTLLTTVDSMLYKAKEAGRNRVIAATN